jgi:glycosyltransferase involved in cell wall biosynthesis
MMLKLCFLADAKITHTQKWVSFFSQRGHEVHLVTFRESEIPYVRVHPVRRTVPIQISPVASNIGKLGYLFYLHQVKKLVWEIAPDILHAHWATSYGLMGACSGYHPFVLSTWGSDVLDFPQKSYWHKKLIEFVINRADHLTATSRMLTDETRRYLKKDIGVHTVPFGVDIEKFQPRDPAGRDRITVGIVKKLEEKYGIEYLIRAFSMVFRQHPGLRLLVVGDGSQEVFLKRLCAELGIQDAVRFAGFVEHDRVPDYLNQMDIFVVPSVLSSETFGVAAVEASACQLPVIASNIGGLPEVVVEGETGFLVPPRNPQAIAEKLVLLMRNENRRRTMGKAGRKFVERHYIWKDNATQMEELYFQILDRRNSRGTRFSKSVLSCPSTAGSAAYLSDALLFLG